MTEIGYSFPTRNGYIFPTLSGQNLPTLTIAYTVLSYHNGKIQEYSLEARDGDTGDLSFSYIERNGVFSVGDSWAIDVEVDEYANSVSYIMLSGDGFHDYSTDEDKYQSKAKYIYEISIMRYDEVISYLK